MSTFLHYVHCKDALLDCSAPGGERCESLTWVDEIVRLLPIATINMCMKFKIEIPQQSWFIPRKPCPLKTDGWTNWQTDEVNPVYPPTTLMPVGIAPTTSSFSTLHLASTDCIKTTARRGKRHLSFGIWCTLYQIEWVINFNGLLGTAVIGVHVVHTSCVIIAYTLETLSSLT